MIVWLNVGGEVFMTTKETLVNAPYFAVLLGGTGNGQRDGFRPPERDEDGHIFLDRSPELFRHVLAALRGERLAGFEEGLKDRIRHELEFFGIEKDSPVFPTVTADLYTSPSPVVASLLLVVDNPSYDDRNGVMIVLGGEGRLSDPEVALLKEVVNLKENIGSWANDVDEDERHFLTCWCKRSCPFGQRDAYNSYNLLVAAFQTIGFNISHTMLKADASNPNNNIAGSCTLIRGAALLRD